MGETDNHEIELQEIIDIYIDLAKQRDNAKSKTLYKLLDEEISNFVHLSELYTKYISCYGTKLYEDNSTSEFLNEALKTISQIENKEIAIRIFEDTKRKYNLMQALDRLKLQTFDFWTESFWEVVGRDFKDWNKFIKMLASNAADLTSNAIPGVSEIKGLYDGVKSVAELINEFEKNGTDYSDVDIKLAEIETHIEVMNLVKASYEQLIASMETKTDA